MPIEAMLNFKLLLKDGRSVFLNAFFESKTYSGLLEGKPDASINCDVLKSLGEIGSSVWPREPNAILGIDFYQDRIHENLPSIICAGQFISYEPARDLDRAGSSMVVVWLQEEMFPLLHGANSDWIRDIPWNQVARDFDW